MGPIPTWQDLIYSIKINQTAAVNQDLYFKTLIKYHFA